MNMKLQDMDCIKLAEDAKPLGDERVSELLNEISGWKIADGCIEKEFSFRTYLEGLEFSYLLGKLAENQGHHPDILIKWRNVKVSFFTHDIGGLSENDFIMAAKADQIFIENYR